MKVSNFSQPAAARTWLENLRLSERNGTLQKISRYFRVFTRGSRVGALKREVYIRARTCHAHKYTYDVNE